MKEKGKSQIKTGAVLSYINIVISILSGFIITPMLIRGMGNSEYGVYQMAAALISYVSVLDLGLHNSVTRYVAKYQAQKDERGQENFLAVSMILFAIIAVFILVVCGVIYCNVDNIYRASATQEERALIKKLLIILSLNLAISMPGAVFTSIVTAYERFFVSKFAVTLKMIIRFITLLLISFIGYTAFGLVILDFILNMAVIVSQMIYCFGILKIKIRLHDFSKKYVLGIFSFSMFVFIASITDQINWKADTTILGIMLGTTAVTLYSIAGSLVTYYRNFSSAISGVFLPKATKMVATGRSNSELTDLMIKVGRIQLMIVGLLLVGFVIIGKEFILIWVGEEFLSAYYWFLIMAVPLLIPMTQSIGINILEAKFMHKFRAVVYFFIALGNIILTIVFIKLFGIVGAPLGTGLALVIGNNIVINWYYAKKVHLEIGRFFKETYLKLMPLQIGVLVAGLIVNYFIPAAEGWILIFAKAIVIGVVYSAVIYVFGMTKEERGIVYRRRK